MLRRRSKVIAAAAVSCLALLPATSAQGAVRAAPRPGATYALAFRLLGPAAGSAHPREPVAGCERQLERTQHQHQDHDAHDGPSRPALAIVGASFTAGVGSGSPGKSWAVVLARLLHWDAVIYGDPGAGYVRAGLARKGPVAAEIARLDPRARDGLHPTAPGSVWIAGQVAGILRAHGVRPAPPQPDKAGAIICDWSIPAPARWR